MSFPTRFGSDIGNVLCAVDTDTGKSRTFVEQVRHSVEIPGAFDALAEINSLTGGQAVLISKCSPPVQAATLDWLLNSDFTRRTGIPLESVYFCLRRPEKAELAKMLKLRYYVDDRLDVLAPMLSVRHRILFRPSRRDAHRWERNPAKIIQLDDWPEILKHVARD